MLSKVFAIVFPHFSVNQNSKYYCIKQYGQNNNKICESTKPITLFNINQYFANSFAPSKIKLDTFSSNSYNSIVKYTQQGFQKKDLLNCNIYIFGDNQISKQQLISNKISKTSLMSQIFNSVINETQKLIINITYFNGCGQVQYSINRFINARYSEFLKVYQNEDNVQKLKNINVLIKLQYYSDFGQRSVIQIIKLSKTNKIKEQSHKKNQIDSLINAEKSIKNNIFYYCLQPKNKQNFQILKLFTQNCDTNINQIQIQNQTSIIQQYQQHHANDIQTASITISQISNTTQQTNWKQYFYQFKQQVLHQIQNIINLEQNENNSLIEQILNQKNKLLFKIQQKLAQKQLKVSQLNEQYNQLKQSYKSLNNSYKSVEGILKLRIEQVQNLKVQIINLRQKQQKYSRLEVQLCNINNDHQKILKKNRQYESQIIKIRQENKKNNNQDIQKLKQQYNIELKNITQITKSQLKYLNQLLKQQTSLFSEKQQNFKSVIKKLSDQINQLKKREEFITKKCEQMLRQSKKKTNQKIKSINQEFNLIILKSNTQIHQLKNKIDQSNQKLQLITTQKNQISQDLKKAHQQITKNKLKESQIRLRLKNMAEIKSNEYTNFNKIISSLLS